jgi:hypothetical protein
MTENMNDEPEYLDDDGYPTEAALERIKAWPAESHTEHLKLMEFVKSIWWAADWGWSERVVDRATSFESVVFAVSTGGWSGNEDIMGALQDNRLFWFFCWLSSRRGGHYEFTVRHPEPPPET